MTCAMIFDPSALADLRRNTSIPVVASELLMTRYEYQVLLNHRAADIIMIDPTWCGGITEARKIAHMADTHNLRVTMHDCTGPFTLFAGLHLAINAPNAIYQETVCAHIRTFYADLVTQGVDIQDGHLHAPRAVGIGTALLPDITSRVDVVVRESRASQE